MPVKDAELGAHWRTPQTEATVETLKELATALKGAGLNVGNFNVTISGYTLSAEKGSPSTLPLPSSEDDSYVSEPAVSSSLSFSTRQTEGTVQLRSGGIVQVRVKQNKERDTFAEIVAIVKQHLPSIPLSGDAEDELNRVLKSHRERAEQLEALRATNDAKLTKLYDEANKRRAELEEKYTKKLRLSAPAGYWSKKAWLSLAAAIMWGVLFVAALRWLGDRFFYEFSGLTDRLRDAKEVPVWVLVAMGLAFGVGIWVLRLIIRNALSSLHLYQDARHRKVMTDAFLALRNEAELSEGQVNTILAVLFRPPSIGLAADEGPSLTTFDSLMKSLRGKP